MWLVLTSLNPFTIHLSTTDQIPGIFPKQNMFTALSQFITYFQLIIVLSKELAITDKWVALCFPLLLDVFSSPLRGLSKDPLEEAPDIPLNIFNLLLEIETISIA